MPLALFMQTLRGLSLREDEIQNLIDGRSVAEALTTSVAKAWIDRHPDWLADSFATLELSRQKGIRWVHRGSLEYPAPWRDLSQSPLVFSYLGEPCWLKHPLLAVVGSRTPMPESRHWMQRELNRFLKTYPVGIVSGGARGVDQWAHRLALDNRRPTVCVQPAGLLNLYPHGQGEFWKRILDEGGCILSTFALNEPLRKWAFHVRNRWITGFSKSCLVVEANRLSGSLLTAKLTLEEGREVGTLPVFPIGEQGLANLDLLQEGAQMIRDHADLATFFFRSNFASSFEARQKEISHSPATN